MFSTSSSQKDFEVSPPPTDSISCIAFSPVSDLLAASSWDNKTRIWDIQSSGTPLTSVPRLEVDISAPALCCTFSDTKLFTAGATRNGKLVDLPTGQQLQFTEHDAPIRCANFMNSNILVTGSWDKTLKYWDVRTGGIISSVALPERCYAMDLVGNLLTVATAEKHVVIYNLQNPTVEFKRISSPLKYQAGFAIGSIEGRVGIQYIDEKNSSDNFSFKCHREGNSVFAINAISFHPVFGTFSTAGSDGTFNFWDKDSKQRLKNFNSVGQSITCSSFNKDGRYFAYGVGYDWSKGHEGVNKNEKPKICVQVVQEADVKGKGIKKGFGK